MLALAWSPDGRILAAAAGETVHLIQAETLEEVRRLDAGVWTPALAFTPDGSRLVSGGRDGEVQVWDPDSGELLQTFSGNPKGINSLSFSPDGELLAVSGYDGIVRLLEMESGEVVAEIIGGVFAVPGVALSPDGEQMATTDGRNLRLREVSTQRLVHTLRASSTSEGPSFYTLAYSPDGRILASGDSANTVHLWDPASGELLNTLSGHSGNPAGASGLVWKVAFSPDGSLLASAGGDGAVCLWQVHSGELLQTFSGHRLAATSLAFSPDGETLASGGLDGRVGVWGVEGN